MKNIVHGLIIFKLLILSVGEAQACWGTTCDRHWCDNRTITRCFPANKDDHDEHLRNEHPVRNAGKKAVKMGSEVLDHPVSKVAIRTVVTAVATRTTNSIWDLVWDCFCPPKSE
jgi:hypothetical protein